MGNGKIEDTITVSMFFLAGSTKQQRTSQTSTNQI
jgi:hypothetical protein